MSPFPTHTTQPVLSAFLLDPYRGFTFLILPFLHAWGEGTSWADKNYIQGKKSIYGNRQKRKSSKGRGCLVVAFKDSTLSGCQVLEDKLSTVCWFAGMKMNAAGALYCLCIQHRAHTARHCYTTLLILLPTCLSSFLLCISSGVNSSNHHCLVFLLLFSKELFSAFFERHLQRNNFEGCLRNYLLCFKPLHNRYQPTHQVVHGDMQAFTSTCLI